MKKCIYILIGIGLSVILISCSTTFQMVSEGESFDALSKITNSKLPCMFPNGGDSSKNLTFCMKETGGYYNIYLKDNVLTTATIKKTDGFNYNLMPSYNKATNRIVFLYWDKTNFDIYYIDANKGKAITQVTNTDENEYSPAWSFDGKKIIFEKGAPPRLFLTLKKSSKTRSTALNQITLPNNQIWIKDLSTGELKMVGQGSFPKFSPDGKYITFVKYDLNKSKTRETGTIWIMTIDGENQKQLTDANIGYAILPNWSPNGKEIIFQLAKPNKKDPDIYSVDINGENLKQYTINKSNDFSPYWSEDGFIYFSSDRGSKIGDYQIWRFKMSGQQ